MKPFLSRITHLTQCNVARPYRIIAFALELALLVALSWRAPGFALAIVILHGCAHIITQRDSSSLFAATVCFMIIAAVCISLEQEVIGERFAMYSFVAALLGLAAISSNKLFAEITTTEGIDAQQKNRYN